MEQRDRQDRDDRLECLRLADHDLEPVDRVAAARKFYDFVIGDASVTIEFKKDA